MTKLKTKLLTKNIFNKLTIKLKNITKTICFNAMEY